MYIIDSPNRRRLIVLILLHLTIYADGYGQNTYDPIVPSEGRKMQDFIPKGWKLLKSTSGDLNKDGIKDVAIVIESIAKLKIPEDSDYPRYSARNLLIVFGKSAGGFKLVTRNNSFIAELENPRMDEPLQELLIEKGILKINFHLWYSSGTWTTSNYYYVFRYQRNQFELIGFTYSSFHRASMDFEEYNYNFSTKKRSHTIESENKKKVTWKSINITTLKTLDELTQPYEWDQENGIAQ